MQISRGGCRASLAPEEEKTEKREQKLEEKRDNKTALTKRLPWNSMGI